ncbi:MAG TPA: hypothetical protein VGM19_14995 [Armatimonadota bacterium]
MLCRLTPLAVVLTVLLVVPAFATSQSVWQGEAESVVAAGNMANGGTLVDDAAASGGKTVCIPFKPGAKGHDLVFGTPRVQLQGRCEITFWVRGENLPPLSHGMRLTLVAHDKTTMLWAYWRETRIYGDNLNPQGYTALTFDLNIPFGKTDTYAPEFILDWEAQNDGVLPVLYLDKLEIKSQVYETPEISEVWPDKVHYLPGATVAVRTTVVNPTAAPAEITLVGEETRGLDVKREVFRQTATLAAGASQQITPTYKLGPEEYGREIRVALLVGGKEVSAGREYFGVSKVPLWVAGGSGVDRSFNNGGRGYSFYVSPASGQQSWADVLYSKSLRRTYFEFFSWSPGDITDQAPEEDPFLGGEGRAIFRSKQTVIMQNGMLNSVGLWPVSYVNGTAWADSGYKLFQQHPEWFLYDANGEVAGYEMDGRETYRRRNDIDFDVNSYQHIFFQAVLNHSLPEVQRFIADQYIRCGKVMGFRGVRMDVRYLEVYPGERDFYGREIAKTYEEADKISAAAVHNVKAMVHKEIPDFTFGYNYASPEETKDMRLTMMERCEGGAWMLDEIPCVYQEKTSPFHIWKAYARRMTSWGDQVRKWGGVYNPYDFRRGAKYDSDLIYSAMFRIICGGHDYGGWFLNSRTPVPDYGLYTNRFSELIYSTKLDWIPEIKGAVQVQSAAPLWWEDMCYWSQSNEGKKQLIVHLVNPPKSAEVEENPNDDMNPPVRDIQVTCAPAGGQAATAAYLVSTEPLELTGASEASVIKLPLRDAGAGKMVVTVPSVLFWKTLVFQF